MQNSFNYKEKSSFVYFYAPITLAVGTVLCFVYKWHFKNLIPYPYTAWILLLLTLIFVLYAIVQFRKAQDLKNNPNPISLSENSLSFPDGNKLVEVRFGRIRKLQEDTEEGSKFLYMELTDRSSYEFDEDNFDTKEEYQKFVDSLFYLVNKYEEKVTDEIQKLDTNLKDQIETLNTNLKNKHQ